MVQVPLLPVTDLYLSASCASNLWFHNRVHIFLWSRLLLATCKTSSWLFWTLAFLVSCGSTSYLCFGSACEALWNRLLGHPDLWPRDGSYMNFCWTNMGISQDFVPGSPLLPLSILSFSELRHTQATSTLTCSLIYTTNLFFVQIYCVVIISNLTCLQPDLVCPS